MCYSAARLFIKTFNKLAEWENALDKFLVCIKPGVW